MFAKQKGIARYDSLKYHIDTILLNCKLFSPGSTATEAATTALERAAAFERASAETAAGTSAETAKTAAGGRTASCSAATENTASTAKYIAV